MAKIKITDQEILTALSESKLTVDELNADIKDDLYDIAKLHQSVELAKSNGHTTKNAEEKISRRVARVVTDIFVFAEEKEPTATAAPAATAAPEKVLKTEVKKERSILGNVFDADI